MPTPKTSSKAAKPAAKKTTAKVVVNLQMPGQVPAKRTLTAGTTVGQFVQDESLTGYEISVAGKTVTNATVLEKNDIIRVGIKTKNG